MPLVGHNNLPCYSQLSQEGQLVLSPQEATRQDIRELHIGLLNMMPDAALTATERQFMRLIGSANPIAQFLVHPFSIPEIKRGTEAQSHIDRHYSSFENIQKHGLDALIITGANISQPHLSQESFWQPLGAIFDWAKSNVTSTYCSCLASHALLEYEFNIQRQPMPEKKWGIYSHRLESSSQLKIQHPLVSHINTRFDVPHSRHNDISMAEMQQSGLCVLIASETAGAHLAVSADGLKVVYAQGHPEYDAISLLKEFKRELMLFFQGARKSYPSPPENYFEAPALSHLEAFKKASLNSLKQEGTASAEKIMAQFPEEIILQHIPLTWHDTSKSVFNNWLGLVYQTTHLNRKLPFMELVNPENPLDLP